ncbi:MAG: aminotransferase class I/II-fold pyridoxal phosphate-dependent enzyme [Lachnospiraceae bacterium]|nr:aminotransferase class I/II-fold pyridoxal phosphate-dependent enzyme [Lachnospiraceae bacterium]
MEAKKRLYLSSPTMHGKELEFINEAFDTNWVAPLGKNVDGFEEDMQNYLGEDMYAAALSSGTDAIHLSFIISGIKRDDVVFGSDLTFAATVNPISYIGAKPVFIDSDYESWNMDPKALEKAFEKYPDAKAVITANLYGTPARLDEIARICREHNAVFIEDAAESLGASYNGEKTGRFGDMGILSFNGNKIITTSGGGMLVSKNEADVKKARFLATQAREPARHYEHKEIGYNYRMSNIVAGIGRGQMLHLDEHVRLKTQIRKRYEEAFSDIEEITLNPYYENSEPNFWLTCMTIDEKSPVKPLDIMEALDKENIETRPIWKPMHLQPVYAGRDFIQVKDGISVGEDIFNRGLCLPSDIKNTEEDMEKIISIIRRFFR